MQYIARSGKTTQCTKCTVSSLHNHIALVTRICDAVTITKQGIEVHFNAVCLSPAQWVTITKRAFSNLPVQSLMTIHMRGTECRAFECTMQCNDDVLNYKLHSAKYNAKCITQNCSVCWH